MHDQTFWTMYGAIAQSVLALAALVFSFTTLKTSLRSSDYDEMDRMYFDLLGLRLQNRHLRRTQVERTDPDEIEDYNVYAYMVWNFIEAVHDRCERDGRRDQNLCRTWYPVIRVENELHREWFDDPDNEAKFKLGFRKFINRNGFLR